MAHANETTPAIRKRIGSAAQIGRARTSGLAAGAKRGATAEDRRTLADATTALFAGLFIVGNALHVFGEAFLLTGLLEALEHLLCRLVATQLYLDHSVLGSM